jgi:hypothetical protein
MKPQTPNVCAGMSNELLGSLPLEEVKKRTILQQQVSQHTPPFKFSRHLTPPPPAPEEPGRVAQERPNPLEKGGKGAAAAGDGGGRVGCV